MEPDFHNSDYLFVDELSYHLRSPQRGEVIVFRHPEDQCTSFVENSPFLKNFYQGPCKNYIKRIVGLPGETVEVRNGQVKITNEKNPNGLILSEDYIEPGIKTLGSLNVKLEKDEYFVLGDNRQPNASSDSREWGPLKPEYIVGRAWLRVLPPSDMGFIKTAKY
jgi:signal peptidase I